MLRKWLHLIAVALVVVGGVNWGLVGAFNYNLVGRGTAANVVYVLVGLAALWLGLQRNTYLPFLGETVMPCSLLTERTPDHADVSVSVSGLRPGAKVLFWATEPATEGLTRLKDWRQAYLEFANAGVTVADPAGHATLRIRRPQPYTVPLKGALQEHVHWRVCEDNGIVGPVQTTVIPN